MGCREFVAAINCMDGRVQMPVMKWMQERYGAVYVDMITEPGPNKILAECSDMAVVHSIRKRLEISVVHHGTDVVAVVGHYDCAGNPKAAKEQQEQILKAKETIRAWGLPLAAIVGLWVNPEWQVEEVKA